MRRARFLVGLPLVLAFVGCVPVLPVREPPPPDGPGDCHTATENVRELGGCGVPLDDYEALCVRTQAAEAKRGHRFPVACITAAKSCAEIWETCK